MIIKNYTCKFNPTYFGNHSVCSFLQRGKKKIMVDLMAELIKEGDNLMVSRKV